jgi:hypothetical protein
VKYPERKRGYDDKGTLRDPSSVGRIVLPELPKEPLPEIPIASTLWFSDLPRNEEKIIRQGTLVGPNTPSGGGEDRGSMSNRTSNQNDQRENPETRTSETISPVFDWEGTQAQRTQIVASFYLWAKNENKDTSNKALFLFYITWAQGKDTTTYFGLGPESTRTKARRSVLKKLVRKSLDQIRLEDLRDCFPDFLSTQGVG